MARGSCGRQNRVVLAPVAGVKPMEIVRARPGLRSIANPSATEARGIRLRGDRGISRKTTAQGRPGVPAHLRSAVCIFAHDCGCHGHPAFPAPSAFERAPSDFITSGASRREIAMSYPAATPVENNDTRTGGTGIPCPVSPCLRRGGAFRSARGLIICRHFINGFYLRCAGLSAGKSGKSQAWRHWLALALAAPAAAEKRVALVIGNSAYQNVTRLDNPRNDAALMAETLAASASR